MKLAREPASSRPKPCTSQKSAPRTHARSLLFVGSRRKKTDRSQTSYFLFETNSPVRAFDSRAQGLSTPLARRRSSYPPPTPNLVFIHPTVRYIGTSVRLRVCCGALPPTRLFASDVTYCLYRATSSRRASKWRSEQADRMDTILQPNRCRVSTDPLSSVDSQLVSLLRVSPILHPPVRPSHTQTPRPLTCLL